MIESRALAIIPEGIDELISEQPAGMNSRSEILISAQENTQSTRTPIVLDLEPEVPEDICISETVLFVKHEAVLPTRSGQPKLSKMNPAAESVLNVLTVVAGTAVGIETIVRNLRSPLKHDKNK